MNAYMALRIAHITNEPFGMQMASGVQQMVYCLARAQAGAGQSVAVFSRDDDAVHVVADAGGAPREPLTPAHSARARSVRDILLTRYFEPQRAKDVLKWRPDIVHFHSVHIPQNVALGTYLTRVGIPYCVTPHGALFPAALQRRRVKKKTFTLLFERRYLNSARFIHALSPAEVTAVRLHGVRRPTVVIPNGPPADASTPALQPGALYTAYPWLRDRRVFIFVGRLEPRQKGLDLLLEAFAQAHLTKAALVLVGPDESGSRQKIAALAERLGVVRDVVFMGPAFGVDRANLLAAADVFVHPSRWEGVSLSVLAAAGAGKPCLITREADPLGELERAQAAIVVDASVNSISAGLKRAAALSSSERQAMGTRARSVMTGRFSWPAIARELVEAYRSS